jgi:hypothetical protein
MVHNEICHHPYQGEDMRSKSFETYIPSPQELTEPQPNR